jgi:DNA-binding NarL/FixJ family response regulator
VLDLNLPDVNGIDGLIRLRQAAAGVPVVVVSSLADNRVIGACLAAGAAGFVPEAFPPRGVPRGLRGAAGGQNASCPRAMSHPPRARHHGSGAGRGHRAAGAADAAAGAILQLICEGLLNKQIAYELSIAETTVKAHVTAIMRKLGVQSRTQAVLIARETNFASLMPEGG